ncbi:hypothetical protein RF11_16217 [Thelohanellus kitauei]|uniref:Uncharacterized protein n=1 Tax=Thelohanellus kitauei TaxID=669202 RepID=A0A0C2JET6_THEKT|nr:hypothetical protein RF11_16217 [Thelohanellus kitauei]
MCLEEYAVDQIVTHLRCNHGISNQLREYHQTACFYGQAQTSDNGNKDSSGSDINQYQSKTDTPVQESHTSNQFQEITSIGTTCQKFEKNQLCYGNTNIFSGKEVGSKNTGKIKTT